MAHQFYFSLELSSQGVEASLVEELAAHVLEHVGCPREEIPELAGALEQAVARNAFGERRCDVQFRAHNGKLEILVSSNGGRIFQTSRPI